jgi:hypothetical protein
VIFETINSIPVDPLSFDVRTVSPSMPSIHSDWQPFHEFLIDEDCFIPCEWKRLNWYLGGAEVKV